MKWAELWFIKELKSPLGMATSSSNRQCYWLLLTAAQIASSTGAFHCQKAVPPSCNAAARSLRTTVPYPQLASQTGESRPATRHWSWRHHGQLSRRERKRQSLLRFAWSLRKKEHHAGITLETDPFRKNVSKSNPMQEICQKNKSWSYSLCRIGNLALLKKKRKNIFLVIYFIKEIDLSFYFTIWSMK